MKIQIILPKREQNQNDPKHRKCHLQFKMGLFQRKIFFNKAKNIFRKAIYVIVLVTHLENISNDLLEVKIF